MNLENQLYFNLKVRVEFLSQKPIIDSFKVNDFINVLVLGSENVGKTSMIENLSGLDIFSKIQEIPKIKLNLSLISSNISKQFNYKEQVINSNKIMISLNDKSFQSLEKLNEFISQKKYFDNSSTLSIIKYSSNLSFNYSFIEFPEMRTEQLDRIFKANNR